VVEAFVGLDGGSTSTKAVLLDKDRNVLVKTYQLSKGNPIEDAQGILRQVREAGYHTIAGLADALAAWGAAMGAPGYAAGDAADEAGGYDG
jgi:activator of 2-hydroxyglutaryl-CoA dehydratase